ncbi:MAG TPA: lytic transglycosylase domain-containing protein [Fimbriimonas sp.]
MAGLFLSFHLGASSALAQFADGELSEEQLQLRMTAEAATRPYVPWINGHAVAYGVDPALVVAVITVESRGDANAVSPAGAMGLMQLMPSVCSDYGVANPFDPGDNIRGGVALLANHLRRYGNDLKKTLAAYNAGPGRVSDGSWERIAETRRYVPKVLSYYEAVRGTIDTAAGTGTGSSAPTAPPATSPPVYAPPIHLTDKMFEVVRSTQILAEPEGVVENGILDNAADAVMSDYVAGKFGESLVHAKVAKYLAKSAFKAKSLKVHFFSTASMAEFPAAWSKQPSAPGNFVGLAHGTKGSTHAWMVVVARS